MSTQDHRTRFDSVYFKHQPRYDCRIGLVADVDDSRHREWRKTGGACAGRLGQTAEAAGTGFIDKDDIRLAADLDRDRVLRDRAILP
jgi:hypothetical protein